MTKAFKIGVFDHEEKFISSLKSLREEKLEIFDVFTPYPIHEVFEVLKRKSRLPTVAYFIGLSAVLATLAFLYYTAVIDWPVVYGGKPFNSFPSFIVITLVLTILSVTIGSLAVFSARSKLFPGRDNTIFDNRATDDKFVIVMDADNLDKSAADKAVNIMKEMGAIEILDKEFENVKA
jgi:Alternative complex III, ActD subunit